MTTATALAAAGTRVHTPDLDWSQVRETLLMLQLAVGQIEAAMHEGNGSVEVLTQSFTSMAEYLRGMSSDVLALPDTPENAGLKENLSTNAGMLTNMVQKAIVAFQFYDKLAQRLAHVSHSLDGLSDIIKTPQRLYSPAEWALLQNIIRSKYSTEEEVRMFEEVMKGATIAEALQHFVDSKKSASVSDGDVELF